MKSLVRILAEKFPVGGIALHGTTLANARLIQKEGFTGGSAYVCPIGSREQLMNIPAKEILERSIGSTLFAGVYARKNTVFPKLELKPDLNIPKVDENSLPAIVILLGKHKGQFSEGYDNEIGWKKTLWDNEYRSFGKKRQAIAANNVAGFVHLTKEEYESLIVKSKGNVIKAMRLVNSSLALKTLKAIKELIERE